ncbi:MAG: heme oxygenase (biliverdin-producing) [Nevskia sp.]
MTLPTLAERLRAGTRTLHTQAERSGLMPVLLRGQIGRHDYCRLLRNLYAIYQVMEPALARHANHPGLAPIRAEALARCAALAADLGFLHGPAWLDELPVEAAAGEYARRLHTLDLTWPGGLAAHAYVRYLGDLSGGQILGGIVAGALQLEGEDGWRFYRFPDPGAAALAARFREGLNAIPPDREAPDEALVVEAQLGFTLHASLFEQLAAAAVQSSRR